MPCRKTMWYIHSCHAGTALFPSHPSHLGRPRTILVLVVALLNQHRSFGWSLRSLATSSSSFEVGTMKGSGVAVSHVWIWWLGFVENTSGISKPSRSNNEILGFNASPFLNLSSTSTKPCFSQKGMAPSKAWCAIPLQPPATAQSCTAWSYDTCSDDWNTLAGQPAKATSDSHDWTKGDTPRQLSLDFKWWSYTDLHHWTKLALDSHETLIVPAQHFIVSFQAHLGRLIWVDTNWSGLHKTEDD